MPDNHKKFWYEDPCILFTDFVLFPNVDMTRSEKLNALTRLVIISSIIMYFLKYEYWFMFLLLALLLITILNYVKISSNFKKGSQKNEIEEFSIVPTYVGTDFQQTIIAPTFAEEWQIPPPAYDIYTQVPYPGASADTFEAPMKPQSYPYGQYLTRTNLLPSDEYYTHLGCGGARTAREYINSSHLRHRLANQENMMRIYKKKLNRRFKQSGNDTFSPYHSY